MPKDRDLEAARTDRAAADLGAKQNKGGKKGFNFVGCLVTITLYAFLVGLTGYTLSFAYAGVMRAAAVVFGTP